MDLIHENIHMYLLGSLSIFFITTSEVLFNCKLNAKEDAWNVSLYRDY